MGFRIESRHLGEIVVVATESFADERGFFMETYRADLFTSLGLPDEFVQENHSRSRKNVIRGLHFQFDPPMGKLMRVIYGRAFLVAVDIRKGSPTMREWFGLEVSAENKKQVWAPAGFARGICALSDIVEIEYKCTAIYNPKGESEICWNDPQIGIPWPTQDPILSEKDRKAQSLAEWLTSPKSDFLKY